MSNNKKLKPLAPAPTLQTRNLAEIEKKSGNLYEAIAIMGRRANQVSVGIKEELHAKLREFANHNDDLEEVHENREQIEISRHYERLPHPTLVAFKEYNENRVFFRYTEEKLPENA